MPRHETHGEPAVWPSLDIVAALHLILIHSLGRVPLSYFWGNKGSEVMGRTHSGTGCRDYSGDWSPGLTVLIR